MSKHTEHNTREHILATGEALCLQRGFVGMGLSELLKTAEVPKGSFYHYFRSKEAFGVAMLERYFANHLQRLEQHFSAAEGSCRDHLLAYYQQTINQFSLQGKISDCLTVKLSAEVCDLSEDMRIAMDKGTCQVVTLLADTLESGRRQGCMSFEGDAQTLAEVLHSLWLGARLQAKISRSSSPLESAMAHAKIMITTPGQ
ncbi:TetR/AcrR family transcriptional regulator [Escherichia sp. E4736]|uniref:TetR/AcrR family transcriptional regulator n=1 Tax=Escherichia sp. E4736 TaxID=2044466 RepID=UPI001080C877|nr:TetR/AcrR family transcriptional regulator [Escherichia sp. E4736]TGB66276.1 TetR family transcriptional regulator [Escherichia coli]TLI98096.1 TetR/AcrR family transcriptional regulator [Escherichia sp. E4736]